MRPRLCLAAAPKRRLHRCRLCLLLLLLLLTALPTVGSADDIDIYKSRTCPADGNQNYRFIFVVDNSGSMSDVEFAESKKTIDASISYVIDQLPKAEVAVVQYGTLTDNDLATLPAGTSHDYDVTVPFTKNKNDAVNWNRIYGPGSPNPGHNEDHTPASMAKMRIDNVYAPGGSLDIGDGEIVQFVFFTDAERDSSQSNSCCTSIVSGPSAFVPNYVYSSYGEYDALKNGTVLPGGVKAQFTVLNNSTLSDSIAASAAIASVGGSYTGSIESNATDPDGSSALPRRFVTGSLSAENDVSKILSVLDDVIAEITVPPVSTSDTFVQASVDINLASFSSDNRAFFSLFAPSDARSWRGNIKGYFVNSTGLTDTQGAQATINSGSETSFSDTAQSFWSSKPDGPDVLAGGANEQIVNAVSRKLYTHLGNVSSSGALQEQVVSNNTNITSSHLNVGTEEQRKLTLDWLQTAPMGDSLHSQPVLVRYGNRDVLFAVTNQGVLHAIDTTDPMVNGMTAGGEELWGFIPKELLSNLPLLSGTPTVGKHVYGLDGKITRWHNDHNRDGIVNGSDSLLLVFGQRRGGRSYFALDVTDPLAPALEWTITGGTTDGFDDLMQTWSQPALITVAHTGQAATGYSNKDTLRVLAFSGGYDDDALDGKQVSATAGGGAIYLVDREGRLLWKADTAMGYSMPADVTVIDSNDDAIADRMYAVDLAGQIWRIDLADMSSPGSTTVNLFATVANTGYQPFHYPPTVSLTRLGGKTLLAITIGSGDRTDPLNVTAQNYLYTFMDSDIANGPPATMTNPLTSGDLYDITDLTLGSTTASLRQSAYEMLLQSDGWVLKLQPGEKVLAGASVVENTVLVTTFRPVFDGDPTQCETTINSESRLYSLALATGSPLYDSNGMRQPNVTGLTTSDRSEVLAGNGIASTPQSVFPQDGDSIMILVGKDLVSTIDQRLVEVFWHGR